MIEYPFPMCYNSNIFSFIYIGNSIMKEAKIPERKPHIGVIVLSDEASKSDGEWRKEWQR